MDQDERDHAEEAYNGALCPECDHSPCSGPGGKGSCTCVHPFLRAVDAKVDQCKDCGVYVRTTYTYMRELDPPESLDALNALLRQRVGLQSREAVMAAHLLARLARETDPGAKYVRGEWSDQSAPSYVWATALLDAERQVLVEDFDDEAYGSWFGEDETWFKPALVDLPADQRYLVLLDVDALLALPYPEG